MRKKIITLFKYRKLPSLIYKIDQKNKKDFTEKLIQLQLKIYELDSYLETKWKLKEKKLARHWEAIYDALIDLNYKSEDLNELTSHIKRYQLHEEQLRINKLPTRLSKDYYYYYKSCDVRLIRDIIYDHSKFLSTKPSSNWRIYDTVTEINDDVEDVFEDQLSINGNSFLLSIINNGVNETKNEFIEHLNQLKSKSIKKFGNTSDLFNLRIHYLTIKRIEETISLIKKNSKAFKKKSLKLKNIKLYKHLNAK